MGALTSAAILGPCPHALQRVMSSVMMAMNDDEDRGYNIDDWEFFHALWKVKDRL